MAAVAAVVNASTRRGAVDPEAAVACSHAARDMGINGPCLSRQVAQNSLNLVPEPYPGQFSPVFFRSWLMT